MLAGCYEFWFPKLDTFEMNSLTVMWMLLNSYVYTRDYIISYGHWHHVESAAAVRYGNWDTVDLAKKCSQKFVRITNIYVKHTWWLIAVFVIGILLGL